MELLKLLLSDEKKPIDFILSEIEVGDFSHPVLKKIATLIFEQIEGNGQFQPQSLLNEELAEREKNFLAKLLFQQERFLKSHIPSELMELAADCIEKIWRHKNSIKIKNIRNKIKNSEKDGEGPENKLIEQLIAKQKLS